MHEDDDVITGSLELLVEARRREASAEEEMRARAEVARDLADEARLALSGLAESACQVVAARLLGLATDGDGRPISKEREDTAWEVLARIGVPRLRATAIAPSLAASTRAPAPDSPGWEEPEGEEGGVDERGHDPASIDAQIENFLAGARAARDLHGGREGDAA